MRIRNTILLLIAVIATGLYIQFGERSRETTDEKKASARLALKFDPDRVSVLRIETPDSLYIINHSNNAWRIMSPVNANADATAIMRIIDTIAALRKSEMITLEEIRDLGIKPSSYGFDMPKATITLKNGDWLLTVMVGKDSPGSHQLYMKREGRDEIIVTDRDILDVLPTSILDIRDRHLFSGQPGNVQRIELQANNEPWQSSRDEKDQWIIERPVYARGLSGTIRQWLDGLYEFRVDDFIADSVAAGSLYGFDEPVAQVSLFNDNKPVPQVLKVGRAADVEETSHYATIAGQDAVFTVTDELLKWLQQDTEEFRDSRLLAIPSASIGYIRLTQGEFSLQIEKNTQDVWEVTSPKRFATHEVRMQKLLNAWSGARAQQFIDPPYKKTTSSALSKAARTIRFARSTPSPATLTQANATNIAPVLQHEDITFILADKKSGDTMFVSPADTSYIIELSTNLLKHFSVNPLDYRDPVVLSQDAYEIRRITQKQGAEEITVDRTNGLFRARSTELVPDAQNIEQLLTISSRLIAVRLIEEDSVDIKPYGLNEPSRSIILGLSGSAGINRVILIGKEAGPDETYAMIQGTDLVFTLSDEALAALTNPVASLLVPKVTPSSINEE